MNTLTDKIQHDENQSTAGERAQTRNGDQTNSTFVDDRPEVISQNELFHTANSSTRVKHLTRLESMANEATQLRQFNAVSEHRTPQTDRTFDGVIQRLGANEKVPSLEDQAALVAAKDGDLPGATSAFFSEAVKTAEEAIGSEDKYGDLQDGLSTVTLTHKSVKTDKDYERFWRELSINIPSGIGYLASSLRSSSRQRALAEAATDAPVSHIPESYSFVKDHLISTIIEDDILAPLLKAQFSAMVGRGMYGLQPGKDLEFIGHMLTKSSQGEKAILSPIVKNYQADDGEKIASIRKNKDLAPLIKREAMTLLERNIIDAQGGHSQLYVVLQKNAKEAQIPRLNEIYGILEEHADKAESQVLKKAVGVPVVSDFLKSKKDFDIAEFDFQKPALRDKLMSTLFVARLLDPKTAERYPVDNEIRGEWKNGGNLADDVIIEQSDEESEYQALVDPDEVKSKLKDADSLLKDLVNKNVLSNIVRPQVKVDTSFGHRAFQLKDHISVSISDGIDTIIHEVGHYIEINFPDLWYDASLLLHSRHQKAGGLNAESDEIGEQEDVPDKKGRYQGEYPATGTYTSKIYETGGATELTSMTMEYLATPEKARELITKDPFQALVILRRIQPDDPELKEIYASYEKNLPHKDSEERARLLRRVGKHREMLTELGLMGYFKTELAHLGTMGLHSLRILEDQMETLPTSQLIINLLDEYPTLGEKFNKELDEAKNYPSYKLNALLRNMRAEASKL